MKKLVTLVMVITIVIGSYTVIQKNTKAEKVSILHDIDLLSIDEVKRVNSSKTLIEKKATIEKDVAKASKQDHQTISQKEQKLLARLVHAEAKGEPYVGKVAVATVVLNRVEHKHFPDTVQEVIYQENAFQPVQNGSINEPADKEAIKAVKEALAKVNKNELLYFYNPDTATSDWIFTREVIKTIGNHAFAI